jgi:preprotein translocase subunit SecD
VRRNIILLAITFVLVVVAFGTVFVAGNTPVLGLDLQGGVSVVLSPVGKYKADALDVAVDVIRSRVDSLGVAEPEISRQGNDIVVDLPGVKDRAKAERLVGQTAELRFRPVLAALPAESQAPPGTPTSSTTTPTTTTPTPTTTTAPAGSKAAAIAAVKSCDATAVATLAQTTVIPTTTRVGDTRGACVVLPNKPGTAKSTRYYLGPAGLTGKAVSSAKATFISGTGWTVNMDLTGTGSTQWDALAQQQFHKQVAIVLDGLVQSAPTIQPTDTAFSSFQGKAQISGNFTGSEASDLAKLINYGALPVQLKKVNVENVSPTLGQDQLDAGIAAGIIGLVLVAIYMLVFYRLLGVVVILGIGVSALLLFALITSRGGEWIVGALGGSGKPVLTLAGVTGIIVSVGITVDSYIVYYERMKDELRAGATVRSCVDRSFTRSFRTIVAADLVSLIGAGVLFFLAIGSVKGFAFYLGLSTILDLFVAYFFMHPIVSLMARRPELVRMPGVGIAAGLDAKGVVA